MVLVQKSIFSPGFSPVTFPFSSLTGSVYCHVTVTVPVLQFIVPLTVTEVDVTSLPLA